MRLWAWIHCNNWLLFCFQYGAVNVPYPKDPGNLKATIDAQEKEAVSRMHERDVQDFTVELLENIFLFKFHWNEFPRVQLSHSFS